MFAQMKQEVLKKENEFGRNGVNGFEGYDLKKGLICMNCRPAASWDTVIMISGGNAL